MNIPVSIIVRDMEWSTRGVVRAPHFSDQTRKTSCLPGSVLSIGVHPLVLMRERMTYQPIDFQEQIQIKLGLAMQRNKPL